MRDPNRINRILEKLRAAWLSSPDLRLGQLVMNAIAMTEDRPVNDIFYIEDDQTEKGLNATLKAQKEQRKRLEK
jgi:uncharacterized protein YihD (DUF1040 family)